MKEYLRAVNKTNEMIHTKRTVHKGDIFQFEFGKNYSPEMSYEHRGLVIGVKNKLLYFLPICSYDASKHPNVFHPIDNPESKSDWYLLKASEYNFIQHDSVLKLNDLRTVSVNRILYHQKDGKIESSSEVYRCIEKLVITKCFPTFIYEFEQIMEQNSVLKKNCEEKENTIVNLQKTITKIAECLQDILKNSIAPEETMQKIEKLEIITSVKENT